MDEKIVCDAGSHALLAYEGVELPLLTVDGIEAFFGAGDEMRSYARDVLAREALDGCECHVEGHCLVLSGAVAPTVPGDSACNAYVSISLENGALLSAQCPFCATLDCPGYPSDAEITCCHGFALVVAFLLRPELFVGLPTGICVIA